MISVTPREHKLLKDIERAIHKPIPELAPPSVKELSEKRSEQLAEKVRNIIAKSKKLKPYRAMVDTIMQQSECAPKDVAAALAYLIEQVNPLATTEL